MVKGILIALIGVTMSMVCGAAPLAAPGHFSGCEVLSYAEREVKGPTAAPSAPTGTVRGVLHSVAPAATIERSWVVRSRTNAKVTYAVKQTLHAATGGAISTCAYSPNRVLATLMKGKSYAAFVADMQAKGYSIVRELMKDLNGNSVYIVESADAEEDAVQQMTMSLQSSGFCESIESDDVYSISVAPNDGRWSEQWGMAKIGAPKAWNTRTDSSSVLVAVLDTGVNFDHVDLNQNLWVNPGELPGDDMDDDNDGIVDDVYGISVMGGNLSGSPMDDMGHGSHCAGIIGAVGNNRRGVAGVAWKAKIMGLKFISAEDSGFVSDAITCLAYAAQKGVKIVNCSFGSDKYNTYLRTQIQLMAQQGVIFVCAAGNKTSEYDELDNDKRPFYPANYCTECSNVVVVAATDQNDNLASFSHYGAQNVQIAAPGVDILSTVLGAMVWECMSGTSMATPHVAGALALLMAEYPNENPYEIVERLYAAGEEVPALAGKVRTGRRLSLENFFGLPAPAAVTASQGTIPDAVGLYWTAVANATHYRVWRADAVDGAKTALSAWQQGLTFSDETALAGTNYWYFVQAAASADGTDASSYSEGVPGFRPEIPANRVTVTFNAAGGTVSENRRNYMAGDTYGDFPSVTYANHVFLGWHTASTGGTRVDGVSIVRADVTTLFAQWAGTDELRVENLAAQQRYPWNGKVDVTFDLAGVPAKEFASLSLTAAADGAAAFTLATFDGTAPTNLPAGSHRVVWNADRDKSNTLLENLTISADASIDIPRAPASGTASNNVAAGGIDLAWTAAHGASSYEIWRSTSSSLNTATKLLDSMELTCLDGSGTMGTLYYYWIKSKSSGGTSPDALALSARRGNPTVTITFNGNGGTPASQTKTYTANEPYGSFPSVSRPGYTFSGWYTASSGGSQVTTSSIVPSANTTLYAHWSAIVPPAPTNVSATDGTYSDKVVVTWNAVSGATSYEIWRSSSSSTGSATKIGTSTTTSYTDTTVPAGSTYYYWVKAVNTAGTSGFSSYDGGLRVRSITGLTLEGPEALPSGCSGAYRFYLGYSDGTREDVTSYSTSYVTWSIPTNEFAEVSSSYTSDSEHGYYRYLTAKTVTSLKQVVVTAKYSYNGTTVTGTLTVSITPPGNLAYSYRLWPDGTGSLTGYLGSDKTTVTSLSLPSSINGVTIRGTTGSWMQNLSSLTSVTIPSTFGSVSYEMFYDCRKLTSVSIPNSVTNIGSYAFCDCDALQTVTLPNSIKTIGNDAFYSCNKLQSVTLPNGLVTLGSDAFRDCTRLPSISLPNSLVTIGSYAFAYCSALKQLTIPSSVKTIEPYAFRECSAMTQIIIPDSVTSIGSYAFRDCRSLTSITIPDSVKSLLGAFYGCYGLKTVSLPDSLTSIDAYSFLTCTNLTAITVGSNNTAYKDVDGVLFNKSGTTLVKYPDGKSGAYTIPSGTTTIDQYAFYCSPKLTSLAIPASVTSINFDNNAIYKCTALQSISVNSSNPSYRCVDGVVYNKNGTTFYAYPLARTGNTFVVPDGVRNLNYNTGASPALTNVLLSDSLQSLPPSSSANITYGKYALDKVPYQLMTPLTERIYALEIDGENKIFAGQSIPLYAKGYFANGRFGYRAKANWMVVSGSAYASINPSNGTFTAKSDVTTTRNISVYAETTLGGAYASAGQYNVQIVPANTNQTVLAFGKYAYIRLRWLPVKNAVKYNIRRSTSSSYGSASIIDTYLKETLDGTETYVDSSALLNTTYYYWVEALDASGNSLNVSDVASAARATGDLTYVRDVLTKLYNGTYTEATFVTYAEKGILKEINYWKGVNSSWVNYIRTGSLTSISGANEMFWRSMYELNTYIEVERSVGPDITGVSAASSSSVTVTWNDKIGATSYYLYRGTSANSSSATKIATVSGTSYTDTSSHSTGTQYYYWVKAVTSAGTTDFGVCDAYMPYSSSATYIVVDLSAGSSATSYPISSLNAIPGGTWNDSYKKTKLVLRRIANGSYTMGCETTETGYYGYEATPHSVTISKPFYMGVFEVTQKQYELVMGGNPSSNKGDARPVEYVSYNAIRGGSTGAQWPSANSVDSTSFMGKIRARTGLTFDLPTEAQWEYACRAGTTTALNSGKNLTSAYSDANMAEVGRYAYNSGYNNSSCDGKGNTTYAHAEVGAYLPNNWGLYDMHGNVWEWCLDWSVSRGTSGFDSGAVTDPKGASSGSYRVFRGGGWYNSASDCRSAYRSYYTPSYSDYHLGFRLSMTLP